jgi:titin
VVDLQASKVTITAYDQDGLRLAGVSTLPTIKNTPLIFTDNIGIQKLVFTGNGNFGIDDLVGTVNPPPSVGPPTAPQNLIANAVSSTEIDLSWQPPLNNGGSPITGYTIQRSNDGITFSTIATVGPTPTSYSNTGLQPNTTYIYQVIATNAVGSSPASLSAQASTNSLVPDPPVNLLANAVSSTEIDLSWQPPLNNGGSPITGYTIYRSTSASGPFTALINVGITTTFADTGLNPASTYYYQVVAHNKAGPSKPSNTVSATTNGLPPGAPNLSASPVSTTQINLSWLAPTNIGTAITNYNIYQSSDGISFTKIIRPTSTTTSFQVTGLSPNTIYYYQVRAVNSAGEGSQSNTASATTYAIILSGAPNSLSAIPKSATEIDLTWAPPLNSGGSPISDYKIYRDDGHGGPIVFLTNVGSTNTFYHDTGLTPNTTYNYKVAAITVLGAGFPTNVVTATTKDVVASPPTVTATAISPTQIDLGITQGANSGSPVTGYQIFEDSGSGFISVITNTGSTSSQVHITGLLPNHSYSFKAQSINGAGNSADSNIATATTAPQPGEECNNNDQNNKECNNNNQNKGDKNNDQNKKDNNMLNSG